MLLASLTSRQLAEWKASSILDPWPEDWQCIQLARLCAFVGNILGGKAKDEPYIREDFLPTVDETPKEPREQTSEEQLAIFRALAAANQ